MFSDFGLLIARYNSSLPTLTDGQFHNLQVDENGRLLVQADVSVIIDFLGLNGASDSSNILVVGTEDGTAVGTARVLRLSSNGSVVIDDGGSSITVDAVDLDIRDLIHTQDSIRVGDGVEFLEVNADGSINSVVTATDLDIRDLAFATDSVTAHQGGSWTVDVGNTVTVQATDLDIRDLSAAQDNVAISDGTDTLAINADGSLNATVSATDLDIRDLSHIQDSVKIGDGVEFLEVNADGSINVQASFAYDGDEAYNATDDLAAAADGLVTVTAAGTPFVDAVSIAVGAGEVLHIYGMDWTCDQNANARLITDDGVDIIVYKHSLNSSASPDQFKYWGEAGRIEIVGAAGLSVKIQIKKRSTPGGDAQGFASLHARKIV